MFEIHELTAYSIDLLIGITTELTDEKSGTIFYYRIFDDKFFEKFDARTRTKKFDEIQKVKRKRLLSRSISQKRGIASNCLDF